MITYLFFNLRIDIILLIFKITNMTSICDYCNTQFLINIPNSHLKPCRFMIWISKYYNISLEALDEGFIASINSGAIKYGGERGCDIYEKLMKIGIQTFLPHQLNDEIIKNGLEYCYQYIYLFHLHTEY